MQLYLDQDQFEFGEREYRPLFRLYDHDMLNDPYCEEVWYEGECIKGTHVRQGRGNLYVRSKGIDLVE